MQHSIGRHKDRRAIPGADIIDVVQLLVLAFLDGKMIGSQQGGINGSEIPAHLIKIIDVTKIRLETEGWHLGGEFHRNGMIGAEFGGDVLGDRGQHLGMDNRCWK